MNFVELNIHIATVFLNIQTLKMNIIKQKFIESLKKLFFNTHKFSNNNNNKFILYLKKSVYPYKYLDDWEKFNETSLPEKEDFHSHLNMEDITDACRLWPRKKEFVKILE